MTLLLAGDIGGTKTLLRLVESAAASRPGELPRQTVIAESSYRSADYPDLVPMVRELLASIAGGGAAPVAACFGIAGPVVDNTSELTNLAWSLQGSRLARELGMPRVDLINDFAAIGHGVLGLGDADVHTLQEAPVDPTAPIAVIGAGTGLGEGFLIPGAEGYRAFSTEGGHVDFAPSIQLEFQLLLYLKEVANLTHVSVERVVSGMGITSIYQFLRDRDPSRESAAMAAIFQTWREELGRPHKTLDLAAEISRAARQDDDSLCRQTLDIFARAYGAEAGDLALKLLPYGGLYVAGGIAAKNLELLASGPFLEAFRAKGRMRPLLERVPLHIVLDAKVGLIGAALFAASGLPRD